MNKQTRRAAEVARLIERYGLGRAGHAHFSPSSSAGWLNCLGFLLANAGKPDLAGFDAAYGTVAHAIASEWLVAVRDIGPAGAAAVRANALGKTFTENGFDVAVDEDMLRHIGRYVEWCSEVETNGDTFVEQHVDYSAYTPIPNQGGTADHFVCEPGKLTITDLKMGTGIRVYVEKNTQAMLYALGVFLEHDWVYGFQTIVIRICQPRLDYFGVWTCTREELLAFGEYVRERADLAWRENAPRSPSPKACQWCADIGCTARSEHLETLVDDAFDAVGDMPEDDMSYDPKEPSVPAKPSKKPANPAASTTAMLAWRYAHRGMYEKWFRQIGEELMARHEAGEELPGLKVVAGRRAFNWVDPEDAANWLTHGADLTEDDIYTREMLSVAQARKLLKARGWSADDIEKIEADLVMIRPGKPTLVPDRDNREDIGDAADDALEG